jgi:hypothetical protein
MFSFDGISDVEDTLQEFKRSGTFFGQYYGPAPRAKGEKVVPSLAPSPVVEEMNDGMSV